MAPAVHAHPRTWPRGGLSLTCFGAAAAARADRARCLGPAASAGDGNRRAGGRHNSKHSPAMNCSSTAASRPALATAPSRCWRAGLVDRGRRLRAPRPAGAQADRRPRAQMVAGRAPRRPASSIADGALPRRPTPISPGTHFDRLASRAGGWPLHGTHRDRAAGDQRAPGQRHDPHSLFAATDESARIPMPWPSADGRDLLGRHRLPPRLRRGDTFSVVYETLTADGEPITWNHAAGACGRRVRQQGRGPFGRVVQGRSRPRRLLRAGRQSKRRATRPADGVLARDLGLRDALHPILNQWRAHRGVDYGAPIGTPVRSVARASSSSPAARTATATSSRSNTASKSHAVRAPEPHRRAPGPTVDQGAHRRSAPPAGPPARTCTSSSASWRAPGQSAGHRQVVRGDRR